MSGEINPDITYHMLNASTYGNSKWETEETEDGTVFHEFDENGNEIHRYYQRDGFLEVMSTMNEDGTTQSDLIDVDGDEQGDLYVTYEYEGGYEEGREAVRHIDYDLDGQTDVTAYLDKDGVITAEEIDIDGDGKADLKATYEYEEGYENGQEAVRHIDYDMDGKEDVTVHLDKDGVITSEEIDTDGDGKADLNVNYLYNNETKETQRIIDDNGDGIPDVIAVVDDEKDLILSEEIDTDGDGILDTHVDYTYDESGEVVEAKQRKLLQATIGATVPNNMTVDGTRILNTDGEQIGVIVTAEKDGQTVQIIYSIGEEIKEDESAEEEGEEKSQVSISYENGTYTTKSPEGIMLYQDFDTDGDGIPDRHTEYFYENGQYAIGKRTTLKPAKEGTTIPPSCKVEANIIYNPEGLPIGVIIPTRINGQEVQKIYIFEQDY